MEKITVDKSTIRALASETRIDILKKIDSGSTTLRELADELNISKSTVHEHLTILVESGLVKKVNKDNKWVCYELTEKGTEILHPHKKTKIIVLLSSAIASFVVGIVEIYRFVKGTVFRPLMPLPEPVIIHEPKHLIVGLILITCAVLFLYLVFYIYRKNRKINNSGFRSEKNE